MYRRCCRTSGFILELRRSLVDMEMWKQVHACGSVATLSNFVVNVQSSFFRKALFLGLWYCLSMLELSNEFFEFFLSKTYFLPNSFTGWDSRNMLVKFWLLCLEWAVLPPRMHLMWGAVNPVICTFYEDRIHVRLLYLYRRKCWLIVLFFCRFCVFDTNATALAYNFAHLLVEHAGIITAASGIIDRIADGSCDF